MSSIETTRAERYRALHTLIRQWGVKILTPDSGILSVDYQWTYAVGGDLGTLLTTSAKQFQPRRETACLLFILMVHKDRENIFHRLIRRHYLPDVSLSSPEAYNQQLPHNLSGAHAASPQGGSNWE